MAKGIQQTNANVMSIGWKLKSNAPKLLAGAITANKKGLMSKCNVLAGAITANNKTFDE